MAKLQNKIPRKVHYCWLSGGKPGRLHRRCFRSWKKRLPGYEFVRWDTTRFDVDSVDFVAEAYAKGKWAFAADYIRLHALFEEGGIYLDCDVEVLQTFDPFLHHSAFSGIEYWPSVNGIGIEAAIIGAEKGNSWIGKCLEYYRDRRFLDSQGKSNQSIMSGHIARVAEKHVGFRFEPVHQELDKGITIYDPSVFTHSSGSFQKEKTVAIHHCLGGWREYSIGKRARKAARRFLSKLSWSFKG